MVSVIIPTYNRENTICRAIDSIINQTYKNIEIIVVDDNSSDNTENVIKEKYKSVRYIKFAENKGACEARNVGVREAQGEIIAFLDSDDEWFENKLQKQLEAIDEKEADIICSGYYQIMNNKKIYIGREILSKDIKKELLKENFIGTPTIMGKRDCFINDPFNTSMPKFQDWELMIRLSGKYKVEFLNIPLLTAYVQENSITRNNLAGIEALKLIMKEHNEEFDDNLKSIYYRLMGLLSIRGNERNSEYFIKSYEYRRSLKSFIDYILVKLNMWSVIKRIHKN